MPAAHEIIYMNSLWSVLCLMEESSTESDKRREFQLAQQIITTSVCVFFPFLSYKNFSGYFRPLANLVTAPRHRT
jgi:hypothetical protein